MKRLLYISAILACINATQAAAEQVTIEYRGRITGMSTYSEDVRSSNNMGFNISVGEAISGYFTYDTTEKMERQGPVYMLHNTDSITQSIKFANNTGAIVYDNKHDLWSGPAIPNGEYLIRASSLSPDLLHETLTTVFLPGGPDLRTDPNYLPGAEVWQQFGGETWFAFNQLREYNLYVNGHITEFRVVPVPEPTTYMMFGAGIGLMALIRRNRRTLHNV